VECIYIVICNLVTKSENLDEVLEIVKLVCAKITQQPSKKPALHCLIYTTYLKMHTTVSMLLEALNLASSGKVTEHNLGVQDQRGLFLFFNILKESKSSGKESFNFLIKYLATISLKDEHAMSEVKAKVANAILEFVKAPDTFQRLDAYLDFQATNSTLLKSYVFHRKSIVKVEAPESRDTNISLLSRAL
ncbi:Eukaryotic translation initiation factor 3 subunit M, partial [Bienertia sinuspersici]